MSASRLSVKAVPGASRSGIAGWLGETLKVRITAAPERGRANAALEETLAGALGIAKAQVRVIAGHTNARKQVEIEGLSEAEVRSRLDRRP